jgi:hypothetical protein
MKVILAENEQDYLIALLRQLKELNLDVNTTETEEGIILTFNILSPATFREMPQETMIINLRSINV